MFIIIIDCFFKVGIINVFIIFIIKIYFVFVNELNKFCMFCMFFKIKINKFVMLLYFLLFNEIVICEFYW